MNTPTTQVRTFSLALKPSGLKKIKSDESHMLTYRVGIRCKFPAKCLLPKANSQKFLYNSTSHSVCDCSLILCASKMEFWQKKKKSLCSLFQGDASVTSNKLAVSRRELGLLICDPPLLLWKQPPSSQFQSVFSGSGMQAL